MCREHRRQANALRFCLQALRTNVLHNIKRRKRTSDAMALYQRVAERQSVRVLTTWRSAVAESKQRLAKAEKMRCRREEDFLLDVLSVWCGVSFAAAQ